MSRQAFDSIENLSKIMRHSTDSDKDLYRESRENHLTHSLNS